MGKKIEDIEDVMATPMVIDTPFGVFSAAAMIKTYPPSNRTLMKHAEERLFYAKSA
eukprot:CAMPEP_0202722704 /NCGR_PEP_ID=MMETSP1385-20130828/159653_1 /ASSEMBLY_ACC=CAM_ASM_000861 /TAXON_ID=933848 /ORGANISM="Elphidium margaritaceum" /LENGTH=55 /DNA_ID=CAMNT_0049387493 /DNA_START=188 /DNA_END=351 /DNA_ORIENTATION=-